MPSTSPGNNELLRAAEQPTTAVDAARAGELERIRLAYARRQHTVPADRYSLFSPDALFASQERERVLAKLLVRHRLTELKTSRILEVGCGHGDPLRLLTRFGAEPANCFGVEILPDRVVEARRLCPGMKILQGEADALAFADASFDLVLQFTLFTSILDAAMRRRIAGEMVRVLRPGGAIIWYDYHKNNPWNRDVRKVALGEIRSLFSGCRIDVQRVTLAPPLARVVAPYSGLVYGFLSSVPWLRTHYLGIIMKEVGRARVN